MIGSQQGIDRGQQPGLRGLPCQDTTYSMNRFGRDIFVETAQGGQFTSLDAHGPRTPLPRLWSN